MVERAVFLALRDLLGRGLAGLLRERRLATATHEPSARTRRRVHADDLDVATQQNRAQRVRRVADLLLPQGRTKTHRVIGDQHAELLRGEHMPHLMQGDRRQDSDNDNDDTDD